MIGSGSGWGRPTSFDLSDAGFLRDRTDHFFEPGTARPLAELQSWRALALLGEPGIGKSTTLKLEADRVAVLRAAANAVSIYINLNANSSETALCRRIVETPTFAAWKDGTSHLYLHLDSLDEALLRVDSFANLLAEMLPTFPTDRMSIRIASAPPSAASRAQRGRPRTR